MLYRYQLKNPFNSIQCGIQNENWNSRKNTLIPKVEIFMTIEKYRKIREILISFNFLLNAIKK